MKPAHVLLVYMLLSVAGFFYHSASRAQQQSLLTGSDRELLWVDSVMQSLTLEQKIAQLLSVRAYSNGDQEHVDAVAGLIRTYGIGGLTFFQGGPVRQARLTNFYQGLSTVPLLISMDAEWGLGMRLDSCFSFPYQMTLGAITQDSTIQDMAAVIARQLRSIGVQLNLAPVVDINNNPANPVIHVRSFGEDKYRVASKGMAYVQGMQQNGILVTAKHFPGHGDTGSDSHHTLPVISHSRQRLDSIELYPYRELIRNGLSGVMTAHLYIPDVDPSAPLPSSLSTNVVTSMLRNDLGFDGLIVTDALDMKGVTGSYQPGDIELNALLAGNDLLLLPVDVPAAISHIREAVENGVLSADLVDHHCRRVLRFKYRAGLSSWQPAVLSDMATKLHGPDNVRIERTVYKNAVTLVLNPDTLLPLDEPGGLQIASLSMGTDSVTPFQWMLGNYAAVDHYILETGFSGQSGDRVLQALGTYDLVIIGLHSLPVWQKTLDQKVIGIIRSIREKIPVVIAVFGHPYLLASLDDLSGVAGLIVSYQDVPASQEVTAQMIFGSLPFRGKLPVTASAGFPVGLGLETRANGKLTFVAPEEYYIGLEKLRQIDEMAGKAIDERVFPGCQIMAARDGKVFYNKCFGFHTYDRTGRVRPTDIYDVASVTKVAATTLAVMKLYEQGAVDIDRMLGDYLPYLQGTDKAPIVIREMMAHQARLAPWIRFYDMVMVDGKQDTAYLRDRISEEFTTRVCEGLYIHRDFRYLLFDTIVRSSLLDRQRYRYSDLGFYFLLQVIENVTNMPLEQYVDKEFYGPLGLTATTFRPREKFALERIIPTEFDKEFRQKLIHGDVHDPGAAMLGGVSGHAGLFSNAADLTVILQMLLQQGEYGGIRYLAPETVSAFTRYQFPLTSNRRGIGFDKPDIGASSNGPVCKSASQQSFGHSGFTGTYVWADPDNGLTYVFLSNRVYPDAANTKLIDQEIRSRIHELFYEAVQSYSLFSSNGTNRK